MKIAIINYEAGNLFSVQKIIEDEKAQDKAQDREVSKANRKSASKS